MSFRYGAHLPPHPPYPPQAYACSYRHSTHTWFACQRPATAGRHLHHPLHPPPNAENRQHHRFGGQLLCTSDLLRQLWTVKSSSASYPLDLQLHKKLGTHHSRHTPTWFARQRPAIADRHLHHCCAPPSALGGRQLAGVLDLHRSPVPVPNRHASDTNDNTTAVSLLTDRLCCWQAWE